MRLLAVTASQAAQGRITEADEIVGRISVGGTIGLLFFGGVVFGLASSAIYLLIRRWLPRGRLSGVTYGVLLLIIAAPTIDPLRQSNPDFDLVGPGWVALVAFGALTLAQGMLVAGIAGRYSRVVPLLGRSRRALVTHAPLLLLVLAGPIVVAPLLVGVVAVVATRSKAVIEAWRTRTATLAGRVILGIAGVVALPGFVATIADIASRP